jgi:hypothetical protein
MIKTRSIILLVVLGACSSATPSADPSPADPQPTVPSVYENRTLGIRFTYDAPWFVEDETRRSVDLRDFVLSDDELARREREEIYSWLDGEGTLGVSTYRERASLATLRRRECRVEATTVAVRESVPSASMAIARSGC